MQNAAPARQTDFWLKLVLVLLCLLPFLVMFLLPDRRLLGEAFWQPWILGLFWIVLLFSVYAIWLLFRSSRTVRDELDVDEPELRMLHHDEQPEIVRNVMKVSLATERGGVMVFRGRLLEPADAAFEKLEHGVSPGYVPLIQQDEQLQAAVILMPRPVEQAALERRTRPAVHWSLFLATLLTTTWAGAVHQGLNPWDGAAALLAGLPYALGLLAILGVHEMGHYFTARRHGIHVTPPFFIPVPFALGTFGAFIQMKSPTENRRALFDVAVAGPLAGLVVAIPALWFGLQESEVVVPPEGQELRLITQYGTTVRSSILFALTAKLALPEAMQTGCTVSLSPLAFAGWLGLLVTALNLLPIGQLDGGHMARSMFGHRIGGMIGSVAMWSLFLLAIFVWPALLLWAVIVFFIAGRGTPPLNDLTTLNAGRQLLGAFTFLLLVLILAPVPAALLDEMGIYCPYL